MARRIIAACVAFLIALTGTVAVVVYVRRADQRALAGQEAVPAFVARGRVPAGMTAGTAVAEGLIVRELIARKAVPPDTLASVDGGYAELVATSPIQPGEIVLRSRFAARGVTTGQLAIPEGKFAVSLVLDDSSRVGPFVTVGSEVAVFDTFNIQGRDVWDTTPAGDHLQDRHEFTRATRLLLPRVEVLAVGSTTTVATGSDDEDKDATDKAAAQQAAAGDVTQTTRVLVTVAVTQDQAERLVHVARTGTVTLALLGPDTKAKSGDGVDDRSLFRKGNS